MQTAIRQETPFAVAGRRDERLPRALRAAHGQLEKRFLEGGAVLLSVMEVLKRLISSLDHLSGALDERATEGTTAGIMETVEHLSRLAAREENRSATLDRLADICLQMRGQVADMQETMRYLRTFAVTVKITGAGLADFSGFAEEILARIQSGTEEVARFARQLEAMHATLALAKDSSGLTAQQYAATVPGIVADLGQNAARVGEHRKAMAQTAARVGELARGVQKKIAAVLSALQIGDITRQRIEHVEESLVLLDAYLAECGASPARDEWAGRLENAVLRLCAAQMAETVEDFQRQCREIVGKISSFVDDTSAILSMRDAMASQNDGGSRSFLHTLEESVSCAGNLVASVRDVGVKANRVAQDTSATVRALLDGIETVRVIKTDIHYMALNSNLRCSKLGEEGRSINVVTAELRIFAGRLELAADTVVAHLQQLTDAAGGLGPESACGEAVDGPLMGALATIRSVCASTEGALGELTNEGQAMFAQVGAAVAKLDFESQLGDVLRDVAEGFATSAAAPLDLDGLEAEAAELGSRIYHTYTMAQERVVHEAILPGGGAVSAAAHQAPASDEDLFEDALF